MHHPHNEHWSRHLRLTGVAIILIGLMVAAWLAFTAPNDDSAQAIAAATNQRLYEFNLERIGGKAAVYAARFNEFLDSLWHGRRLGGTVAVLSTLLGWLCITIGRALGEPHDHP